MSVVTHAFVPFVHVVDVARSIAFYAHLGFAETGRHVPEGSAVPVWASLRTPAGARLMLALASGPVDASMQAILFYAYVPDVLAAHAALAQAGASVGHLQRPWWAPDGEFRTADPDGYVLMVMQG
jgi:catechol 2,3-dioxygenase-like lactoylglutathione lyase family enzyme